MKLRRFLFAFAAVVLFGATARADDGTLQWDFTVAPDPINCVFNSDCNVPVTGSGTLTTTQSIFVIGFSGIPTYQVLSMSGEVDGMNVAFAGQNDFDLMIDSGQDGYAPGFQIDFFANGTEWEFDYNDIPHPGTGEVLTDLATGAITPMTLTITPAVSTFGDPPPVSTPEPSSLALLLIGLIPLMKFSDTTFRTRLQA
jgi:hypothetical protein